MVWDEIVDGNAVISKAWVYNSIVLGRRLPKL